MATAVGRDPVRSKRPAVIVWRGAAALPLSWLLAVATAWPVSLRPWTRASCEVRRS